MFFYVSFLRPPPRICPISKPVTFTPQVANDLRTELYEETIDIYYIWFSPSLGHGNSQLSPRKLTTWRPSNAFKQVTVPPPSNVKSGQAWCICLWAALTSNLRSISDPVSIDLSSDPFGANPFPVVSAPISFVASISGKQGDESQKQEQISRRFGIQTDGGVNRFRIIEQTSFDLDKKLWDSGIGVSAWFCILLKERSEELPPLSQALKARLLSKNGCNVVELGTGVGIASISLSSLISLHSSSSFVHVLATDLSSAIPLISQNISQNKGLYPNIDIRSAVLDWDSEDEALEEPFSSRIDVILMADVTYNTSAFPSLIKTLTRLSSITGNPPPLILLAYKERHPSERILWEMAKEVGIDFGEKEVECVAGAGGEKVEIWIGRRV